MRQEGAHALEVSLERRRVRALPERRGVSGNGQHAGRGSGLASLELGADAVLALVEPLEADDREPSGGARQPREAPRPPGLDLGGVRAGIGRVRYDAAFSSAASSITRAWFALAASKLASTARALANASRAPG